MSAADSELSRWPDLATASIRTQSIRSTVAQRSSSSIEAGSPSIGRRAAASGPERAAGEFTAGRLERSGAGSDGFHRSRLGATPWRNRRTPASANCREPVCDLRRCDPPRAASPSLLAPRRAARGGCGDEGDDEPTTTDPPPVAPPTAPTRAAGGAERPAAAGAETENGEPSRTRAADRREAERGRDGGDGRLPRLHRRRSTSATARRSARCCRPGRPRDQRPPVDRGALRREPSRPRSATRTRAASRSGADVAERGRSERRSATTPAPRA